MAIAAGRHQFGTDNGRITLRTFRDGLAAQAGHDLTIEAVRWSGELVVAPDLTPASLNVSVDLGALVVRAGTGGIKPLTDRDKREIAVSARKVLSADRYPEATFTATSFEPGPGGAGGTIVGTLTLAGRSQPQRLQVSQPAPGQYRATTTIRQTSFGIKPYSAFLGSLKVADAVELEAEVDLSQAAEKEPAA
jgi:polyisoprenoid-binding protein YceI